MDLILLHLHSRIARRDWPLRAGRWRCFLYEQMVPGKRPRARRFHERWRIITGLRKRARRYYCRPNRGGDCATWEEIFLERAKYARRFYSTRKRFLHLSCCNWREKFNHQMTVQEHIAEDVALFQAKEEGVRIRRSRFKYDIW